MNITHKQVRDCLSIYLKEYDLALILIYAENQANAKQMESLAYKSRIEIADKIDAIYSLFNSKCPKKLHHFFVQTKILLKEKNDEFNSKISRLDLFQAHVTELEQTVFTLPVQCHDSINFCDLSS